MKLGKLGAKIMEFLGESKKEIIKGKPFEVYGKIIYPVVQKKIQNDNKGNIIAAEVIPIAFIVEEDNKRYVIPIIEELPDIVDKY